MWNYHGSPVLDIPDKKYYGFAYLITNLLTGEGYVGRKYFWRKRKPKGKTRRVTTESDWKTYYGSSDELSQDISVYGEELFNREIISYHETKGQVNYAEMVAQVNRDVLFALTPDNTRMYYNRNILARYYAPHDVVGEKNKSEFRDMWAKLSESARQDMISNSYGEKMLGDNQSRWDSLSYDVKDALTKNMRKIARDYRQQEKDMI